ncbi:hypothetical protein F4778DRAFT_789526 [Xylariomycetidae sp. FL2044]|nr:hypothetical protein F4778DRAFT_789526 [Xylariomycetidae sp. FL2044]
MTEQIAGEPLCQALRLEDDQRCTVPASGGKGLFCDKHARQCHAMYRGYKRRNARLHAMNPPPYLESNKISLAANDFADLTKLSEIRQVLQFLHEQYALLDRVIMARQKHSKHFYPEDLDYGHKAWVDKLVQQRHTAEGAMFRLTKRYQSVRYENEIWFLWVAERQREQDDHEEKLKKKIKLEAAMFRRHLKLMEESAERRRAKEKRRQQHIDLKRAFQKRLTLDDMSDEALDEFDPIEDIVEDSRARYIDLILHFLWLDDETVAEQQEEKVDDFEAAAKALVEGHTPTSKPKTKNKAKSKAKNKKKGDGSDPAGESSPVKPKPKPKPSASSQLNAATGANGDSEPDKSKIETRSQLRIRLRRGVDKDWSAMQGPLAIGTWQNPYLTHRKAAPIPHQEIDSLTKEIAEIKLLLFCRLLLSHSSLLSIALQSNNIREFLDNPEVGETDLRDLCLRLENPTVQDVRDACADLAREDGEPKEGNVPNPAAYPAAQPQDDYPDPDEDVDAHEEIALPTYFTSMPEPQPRQEPMKVIVCGRSIWNYASENAVSRDGWLQFSIMAKDTSLDEAIHLCRHWDEFSDLNILALWNFFPSKRVVFLTTKSFPLPVSREGDPQTLIFQGFIPCWTSFDYGDEKIGSGSTASASDQGSCDYRTDSSLKQRNFILARMKRNDLVTRRFIQYCVMNTGDYLTLVRDGKTGRYITAPPEEERWLMKRAPRIFATAIYNLICQTLFKAHRVSSREQIYDHMEPVLRTVTRDPLTDRLRTIKPGERVKSYWQYTQDDRRLSTFVSNISFGPSGKATQSAVKPTSRAYYNESDAIEDEILFDNSSKDGSSLMRQLINPKSTFELAFAEQMKRMGLGSGQPPVDLMYSFLESKGDLSSFMSKNPKSGEMSEEQKVRMRFVRAASTTPRLISSMEDLANANRGGSEMTRKLQRIGLLKLLRPRRPDMYTWMENLSNRCNGIGIFDGIINGDDIPLPKNDSQATKWFYFLVEILLALKLEIGDVYNGEGTPKDPWPTPFIGHDLVRAFAMMSPFFSSLAEGDLAVCFLKTPRGRKFKNSELLNPFSRAKTCITNRRTGTSFKLRPKSFWKDWDSLKYGSDYFADAYPMKGRLIVRPVIAKLYRAGVIAPAYKENEPKITPGFATPNVEPHRPEAPDVFWTYDNWGTSATIKSAPHFWSLMCAGNGAEGSRFLDTEGRIWEWRFMAKDYPFAEQGVHNIGVTALAALERRLGAAALRGRVVHAGDLYLIMETDERELLKLCTMLALAVQSRPWMREFDMWGSFVNVDLQFLEQLDESWWRF